MPDSAWAAAETPRPIPLEAPVMMASERDADESVMSGRYFERPQEDRCNTGCCEPSRQSRRCCRSPIRCEGTRHSRLHDDWSKVCTLASDRDLVHLRRRPADHHRYAWGTRLVRERPRQSRSHPSHPHRKRRGGRACSMHCHQRSRSKTRGFRTSIRSLVSGEFLNRVTRHVRADDPAGAVAFPSENSHHRALRNANWATR